MSAFVQSLQTCFEMTPWQTRRPNIRQMSNTSGVTGVAKLHGGHFQTPAKHLEKCGCGEVTLRVLVCSNFDNTNATRAKMWNVRK
jgi:hypothetical protein